MSLPHNIHLLNTPWTIQGCSLFPCVNVTGHCPAVSAHTGFGLPAPNLFTRTSRPCPRSAEEPACKKRRSRSLALSWQSHWIHWPLEVWGPIFRAQLLRDSSSKLLHDACMCYAREFNMFEWKLQNYSLQNQEAFTFPNFMTKTTINVYPEWFDGHFTFLFIWLHF